MSANLTVNRIRTLREAMIIEAMNITVHSPSDHEGPYGPNEVWVQVTGDEPLPDWPTIRGQLKQSHPALRTPNRPDRYYPGCRVEVDGVVEHAFEDWFIFDRITTEAKAAV